MSLFFPSLTNSKVIILSLEAKGYLGNFIWLTFFTKIKFTFLFEPVLIMCFSHENRVQPFSPKQAGFVAFNRFLLLVFYPYLPDEALPTTNCGHIAEFWLHGPIRTFS